MIKHVFVFAIPFLIFLSAVFTSLSVANDRHHPIVPGFERFVDVDEINDAERGQLLLNELNCLSCHAAKNATWTVTPKQAPILSQVGSRILPEHFEAFLLDPHSAKPGTTMPDVLDGKSADEKKLIAESISHFLATTGQPIRQNSTSKLISKGEKLYHEVGCVACHNPQNSDVKISTSIPFGELHKKYSLNGLIQFIANPMHVRPSGRMPQFDLTSEEVQAIASYLVRDGNTSSKLNYKYYEGKWEKLPNFAQLKPLKSGTVFGFDLGIGRNDNFAILFDGYWKTDKEAEYVFEIGSDDGSRLLIDGEMIVESDGIHAYQSNNATKTIPAGVHKVQIQFFEGSGGEELRANVTGGGLNKASFATLLSDTETLPTDETKVAFKLDLEKAKVGREYFQSVGCASCHELKIDNTMLTSTVAAKAQPITELELAGGCLTGAANAPDFGLSEQQVKSIIAGIERIKNPPPGAVDPNQTVHEKLVTLNCYACHNREQEKGLVFGGVVDTIGDSLETYERKDWFTGTQVEMGDEGQHPPSLKSVGSKLNPKWLKHVFEHGPKSRPYMLTRMPKFGADNLGQLAEELVSVDRLTDVPVVTQSETERQLKAHGRFFAGEDGLSCIKCHTFGKYNATGIQAIDLTTMTERLNKDWFRVYMRKPSRFRRGTRMPESWPGGRSFYPDVLDGDTNKQIDAIWEYLADGDLAAKPKGLVRSKMELKAVDAPKMYRNFIEGAGSRAIGVGYPEQVNIAFDAENSRLALIWQENFIDASRHWTGRGQGYEPPLGENVFQLPEGIVISAKLESGAWPEKPLKPQFKGYRFDENRRPIFNYELGDMKVNDQPIPHVVEDRPLLKRKIKIRSSSQATVYFLVAKGKKITARGNSAIVDDRLRVILNGPVTLSINQQNELIATITLTNGAAEIEQDYDW
ncbi:MAG: c-type cytochrome [Mariniblastus sp.]